MASSEVTSPTISVSCGSSPSLPAAMRTLLPILALLSSAALWSPSANMIVNVSGSTRWSSTTTFTMRPFTPAASGEPSSSIRGNWLMPISATALPQPSGVALGRQQQVAAGDDAERVVDPVGLGDGPPQVGVAVLAVGQ